MKQWEPPVIEIIPLTDIITETLFELDEKDSIETDEKTV